jgi:serine/threonine-protein kinase
MPFIQGESLRELLRKGGALPLRDVLRVIRELADALDYAHGQGIVHRDLKPENVLLSEGHALVADLGIAKALHAATKGGESSDRGTLTAAGLAVGTPAYMAPEQAVGDPGTDHRVDLYALGLIAYEMLAGAPPFTGSTPQLVAAHITQPPPPLALKRPEVPPALATLIDRLLEKDPANRPATARDVLHALEAGETRSNDYLGRTRSPSEMPSGRGRRGAVVVVAGLLLVLAGSLGYERWQSRGAAGRPRAPSGVPTKQSVAVLPFENTSGNPADEPFSDGLTDELIAALGKAGISVTGRTSAFLLKGTQLSVRAIADTLRVAAIMTGSVRQAGNRLRVTAQLVNAGDSVLWTNIYDRPADDVFAVQEEIARAIVRALQITLVGGAETPLVHAGTADRAAYERFLNAQAFANQRTPAAIRSAVSYFHEAIALDSGFARAYAGLASAHLLAMVFGNGRPTEELPRARQAALRALELDSTLAEAHAAFGHLRFTYDWQWADGLRALDRAIELDPSYAYARQLRGILQMNQGRYEEAAITLRDALAVDRLSAVIRMNLGQMHVSANRPDEAIEQLEDALELNPRLRVAHQHLGFAYLEKRMPTEAVTEFRRAAAQGGSSDSAQLAYAYGITGQRPEAQRILADVLAQERQRYVQPFGIALAYVGLGDRDAAFRWLEKGEREHAAQMNLVKMHPGFEPLHADSRWTDLLRRMRLDP